MGNALIVRKSHLPKSLNENRAAQYVRMSTDYQRYSIENQAAAIAAYAQAHNFSIVRTYRDEGESGLRLKNRAGLMRLIDDVQSDRADFGQILIYDVSRWGRFQDIDESAHYEFVCKQAGIKVAYCAEVFENDGSLLSSIVKNLKRVMAAEYSRELSAKVFAGNCRIARLGFRSGGAPGYGLRRELVDENRKSKGILEKGQRKHLQTDHVLLRPGPENELRIVAWIFRQFVSKRKSQAEITRELNRKEVPNHLGKPWTENMVHYLLQNENYIGNGTYNKATARLRQTRRDNPEDCWIRTEGLFDPIVSKQTFARAQRRMKEHYVRRSDEELLEHLRTALKQKGQLSADIINNWPGMPSPALYAWRFGSLRNAFKHIVGYRGQRNYDYIGQRPKLNQQLIDSGDDFAMRIRALGASAVFDTTARTLSVENRLTVSLRIGRYYPDHDKVAVWHVHRNANLPSGLILALRLNKKNTKIVDYFVIPTTEMKKVRIALRATLRYSRFDKYHAPSIRDAVRMIMEGVAATSPVLPTKRVTKRLARSAPAKVTTGHARH